MDENRWKHWFTSISFTYKTNKILKNDNNKKIKNK